MTAAPHSTLLSHFTSWNDLSGEPAVVTYSFAAELPAGSSAFSAAQRASARLALAQWDAVSGLSFVEVPDAPGGAGIDLRFRLDPIPSVAVLGSTTLPPDGGEVALNVALFRTDSLAPSATRIGFQTLLHEIGHGLGLSHPEPGTPNATANTIMVATLGSGAPVNAPLAWDRAAVQALYGTQAAEAALGLRWGWDGTLRAVRGDGTPADDVLTGTAHRDALFGGAGRDTLRGQSGDDLLVPGAGDDVIEGGAGWDVLRLDVPRQALTLNLGEVVSAEGRDRLSGIEAVETIDGTVQLAAGGLVGRLVGLYAAAFGRAPDAGGLAFWVNDWNAAPDFSYVAGRFLASPEFAAGPGLAARFTALGQARPAGTDAEALAWLASTQTGFPSSVWVADPQALLVAAIYQQAHGRAPEEAGFRFWMAALDAGLSELELAHGAFDSVEAALRGGTRFESAEALLEAARASRWDVPEDGVFLL